MAVLAACFDESGFDKNVSAIIVAGILASTEQWRKFDKQWRYILKTNGVKIFHATDFENSKKEFSGWTSERKEPFIKDLIQVIRNNSKLFIYHSVDKTEFASAQQNTGVQGFSPYQLCAVQCMLAISNWCDLPLGRRRPVALHFEDGNHLANEVMDLFLKTKKLSNIDKIVMESKNGHSGLQAADLFVYAIRKIIVNQSRSDSAKVKLRIEAIIKGKKYVGVMNTPSTIEKALRLLERTRRNMIVS